MSVLEQLLDAAGLYIGPGTGTDDDPTWVGRIDVRRLPGGGAVSIDYEATSVDNLLQHAEHTMVGRVADGVVMFIAYSHAPAMVLLREREPGWFTTDPDASFQLGIRLTMPEPGRIRHAYCHGPAKDWAEFDVATLAIVR